MKIIESFRRRVAGFLCDNFGHTGPIIGTGDVEVTGKNNRQKHLPIVLVPHHGHRCKRHGCGELFATPRDLAVEPVQKNP